MVFQHNYEIHQAKSEHCDEDFELREHNHGVPSLPNCIVLVLVDVFQDGEANDGDDAGGAKDEQTRKCADEHTTRQLAVHPGKHADASAGNCGMLEVSERWSGG